MNGQFDEELLSAYHDGELQDGQQQSQKSEPRTGNSEPEQGQSGDQDQDQAQEEGSTDE